MDVPGIPRMPVILKAMRFSKEIPVK